MDERRNVLFVSWRLSQGYSMYPNINKKNEFKECRYGVCVKRSKVRKGTKVICTDKRMQTSNTASWSRLFKYFLLTLPRAKV